MIWHLLVETRYSVAFGWVSALEQLNTIMSIKEDEHYASH